MIKFENTEVIGWEHAIRGMRNPMNSWEKSDSVFIDADGDWYSITGETGPFSNVDGFTSDGEQVYIGPNDHDLMMRLIKGGPVHAKYRRMIVVYVDITAPLYWWKEFDTYKIGTVANSCSTMHKIHAKEFTLEDFSTEHFDRYYMEHFKSIIDLLNKFRCEFNDSKVNKYHKLTAWYSMIQLLPSSYNQKRTVMLNYEVLANIYKSRKNHKLDEWALNSYHSLPGLMCDQSFCDWIETLPYSELITGGGEK